MRLAKNGNGERKIIKKKKWMLTGTETMEIEFKGYSLVPLQSQQSQMM